MHGNLCQWHQKHIWSTLQYSIENIWEYITRWMEVSVLSLVAMVLMYGDTRVWCHCCDICWRIYPCRTHDTDLSIVFHTILSPLSHHPNTLPATGSLSHVFFRNVTCSGLKTIHWTNNISLFRSSEWLDVRCAPDSHYKEHDYLHDLLLSLLPWLR